MSRVWTEPAADLSAILEDVVVKNLTCKGRKRAVEGRIAVGVNFGVEISNDFLTTEESDMIENGGMEDYIAMLDDGRMGLLALQSADGKSGRDSDLSTTRSEA